MPTSKEHSLSSRRTFLRRMAVSGLVAAPGSAFLMSCATGGSDDEPADTDTPPRPTDADNPLGIDPAGELEIFIFDGGLGDEYAVDLHQPLLLEQWPDVKISHQANADVTATLQSRFVAGNPPDFVDNGGAKRLDPSVLVANGQVTDLTPLLDAPSWDDPSVLVRDTLLPGTIEQGTYGSPYFLKYQYTVFGLWYNKTLFDQQGWTPPTTWADMLDLCADIKAAGIAPWAYPGANAANYMAWPLLTMAAKLSGPDVLSDIDNLTEGAWQHEAVLEAANALAGLRDKGYFLDGTEGLTHVQSQVQWAQGKVAFVTCGTWLENEIAGSFEDEELQKEHDINADDKPAADFQFSFLPDPLLSTDAAMPAETVLARAGGGYCVPADAAHPEAGLEYMRAMLSAEGARGFTEMVASLTSVEGSADGVELAPGLTSAQAAVDKAGENIVSYIFDEWYASMWIPGLDSHTGDLLAGRKTAQEWAEGMEDEARRVREDDSIHKFTR